MQQILKIDSIKRKETNDPLSMAPLIVPISNIFQKILGAIPLKDSEVNSLTSEAVATALISLPMPYINIAIKRKTISLVIDNKKNIKETNIIPIKIFFLTKFISKFT